MSLYTVLPEQIDELWPTIIVEIKRTDDNVTNSEDIKALVKKGTWQLWIYTEDSVIQLVATTSFIYYGDKNMCRIETIA